MERLSLKFDQLSSALENIKRPLLIIHPKPDIDALSSAFSLGEYLKTKLGFFPDIFSVDRPDKKISTLFPVDRIIYKLNLSNYDAIIFLDRVDLYYKLKIEAKLRLLKSPKIILGIDHHPDSFIPKQLVVLDIKASSTSEIIYRFFDHQNIPFGQKQAQYLLNGIYADTGGFRHNNTTPLALEIVAKLMRQGALITKINRLLFSDKSLDALKLWGIALDRAQINHKIGMAVSFITKEDLRRCGATANDLDGIAEILNTISNSKFSLILSENSRNSIKASLRSEEYKKVDVSKIARAFKGGGHKLASGFEIKGQLRQVGDSWIIE